MSIRAGRVHPTATSLRPMASCHVITPPPSTTHSAPPHPAAVPPPRWPVEPIAGPHGPGRRSRTPTGACPHRNLFAWLPDIRRTSAGFPCAATPGPRPASPPRTLPAPPATSSAPERRHPRRSASGIHAGEPLRPPRRSSPPRRLSPSPQAPPLPFVMDPASPDLPGSTRAPPRLASTVAGTPCHPRRRHGLLPVRSTGGGRAPPCVGPMTRPNTIPSGPAALARSTSFLPGRSPVVSCTIPRSCDT